jgi:Zn ribbon nucleic-acid-binding protein
VFIARATRARAPSTNAPIATWRSCDPHHGFARIFCPECRHDYLLAFSCKARYFCPSCHQKRVLAYGDWVEENVLGPVPHRQYVKCGAPMHVIALIDDAAVIRRILEHLGRWAPREVQRNQRAPPRGGKGPKLPARELTYHPVPDIA